MKLSSVEAKLKNFPVSYAYTGGSPVSSVVKPNLIALLVVEKMRWLQHTILLDMFVLDRCENTT